MIARTEAEDHPVVRYGLVKMLNMIKGLEVAAKALDGWDAAAGIRGTSSEVVLIDMHLPKLLTSPLGRALEGFKSIPHTVIVTQYRPSFETTL